VQQGLEERSEQIIKGYGVCLFLTRLDSNC
jgi:hypothetical protein